MSNKKVNLLFNKNDLQTGDLLLFDHKNNNTTPLSCCLSCYGSLIRCFTKSKYTHSAMVIRNPPWRNDLKGLYVLESSLETFTDAEDNEIKFGVQLVNFDKLVDNYEGHVYVRQIKCERNDEFNIKLIKAHSIVHNRLYDIIPIDYIKAGFFINIGNTHRKNTFFCSSLMTFIYVCLDLVDHDLPWSIIAPKELGTEDLKKSIKFHNCTINDEILIK